MDAVLHDSVPQRKGMINFAVMKNSIKEKRLQSEIKCIFHFPAKLAEKSFQAISRSSLLTGKKLKEMALKRKKEEAQVLP